MTSHHFSKGKCVALAAPVQGHARSRMYTHTHARTRLILLSSVHKQHARIKIQVCGDVNRNMGESVGEGKGKRAKESMERREEKTGGEKRDEEAAS